MQPRRQGQYTETAGLAAEGHGPYERAEEFHETVVSVITEPMQDP